MAAELESHYSSWKSKSCLKKWCQLDRAILVLSITFLWSLSSIPFITYIIRNRSANGTAEDSLFVDQCQTSSPYNGSVCHDALMQYIIDCDDNIILPSSGPRVIKYENMNEVENIVNDMTGTTGDRCIEEVTPFLCLYLLEGICLENGVQILPTSADCKRIIQSSCYQDLQGLLPWEGVKEIDCDSLPLITSQCINKDNTLVPFNSPDPLPTNTCTLNCRENFFCDNMTCVPQCSSFTFYSATATVFSDVIVIVFSWLGFLAGIAVLIISIIRRNTVLKFPSILAIYETLTIMLKDVIQIITYLDREALYCTSPNLIETINNIPPFCVLSGMVLVAYVPLQFNVWWVSHMLVFYLGVQFPFKINTPTAKRRLRVLHVVVVVVGLVVPTFPIIALIFGSMFQDQRNAKLGIRYGTPPPTLCAVANPQSGFFFIAVPNSILAIVGATILVLLIWTVHKKFGIIKTIRSESNSTAAPLSSTEVKLLMVITSFIIMEILSFTFITQSVEGLDPLLDYFECEAPGVDPNKPCSRAAFENDLGQYVFAFFYSSLLVIPAICLVFVLDFSMILNKINSMHQSRTCCSKLQ